MFGESRPDLEVVKEGLILHFLSGYRKFKLITIINGEKSSIVDKIIELSNQSLINDMIRIINFEEVLNG
jgi:hypothetical protein